MSSSRPIRFFHRGEIVEIAADAGGPPHTRTVLEWLREDAHCSGTKEGCAEGDCGACTVVIGERDTAAPGGLALRSVNACIQFLPTLDGKALYTVEDLAAMAPPGQSLHPVQQAMVECHGSQCGFCTPGFVMSLWHSYEHHRAEGRCPSRQELADELSGNLCRCTGYRPILDAGQRMFELPAAPLDATAAVAALDRLAQDPPLQYGPGFHAPRTVEALAALRVDKPEAKLLAGSTDMGLWVTKQFRALPELIYVGEVAALKQIVEREGQLSIGAAASLEDAWSALVARWPALQDVWLRFASPPIRHAGTLGGNVANGSPIGDSPPVLMALGATVVLRHGDRQRRLPLPELYLDYMKNAMQPGEFVEAIELPLPGRPEALDQVRAYKISKRFDCDISAVCAGLAISLDGERVQAVRIAYGGMAATVRRAAQTEAAMLGQPWNETTLTAAVEALGRDYTPLTDMRASAAYRLQVARNLLRRFWLETRPVDPLPAGAVSVWNVMPHAQPAATA